MLIPSQIWSHVLEKHPQTELNEKQIYACWAQANEGNWRLDDDQVKSALKNLEALEGEAIETIPIQPEDGITAIAFAFKSILDDYGTNMEEVAMDSTCKSSQLETIYH
jgi:hypothetical protein